MLLGELCYLRPIEVDDSERIRNWRLKREVSNYFPSFEPISLQKQKNWMAHALDDDNSYYFIICDKISSNPVGLIFLTDIDRINQNAEFGYYIGETEYQGAGIAIEAELLLLNYAFNIQNMHKVYCESLAYNKKVLSIHSSFGFKNDGLKRHHIYKNGDWNDLIVMSVLKEEFSKAEEKIESLLKSFANR